jgi:hypothetical protein
MHAELLDRTNRRTRRIREIRARAVSTTTAQHDAEPDGVPTMHAATTTG